MKQSRLYALFLRERNNPKAKWERMPKPALTLQAARSIYQGTLLHYALNVFDKEIRLRPVKE